MPKSSQIEVRNLKLDLKNFRTVPQKKEIDAIKAMISIKPERFFAVLESIIDDGYLPTENIIILKDGTDNIVKEGNRRIAALKLIHGIHKHSEVGLPDSILERIKNIDENWKTENLKVPCTVFSEKEADKVDRVVTLAHGKGEKASRDPWNSVARARHNRDIKNGTEHGLDFLEKYLKHGKNINNQQKERWGGDYPLTVLDEALRKTYARLKYDNLNDLIKAYPRIKNKEEVENIVLEIGLEQIKFDTLRNSALDFPSNYGIPPLPTSQGKSSTSTSTSTSTSKPAPTTTPPPTPTPTPTPTTKALAINDPRNIALLLKKFSPSGVNRQKVVTLRDEIKKLKISDNPIAFCFVLRSMFEISGKAYCGDHGLTFTKKDGRDKTLVEILRDITSHLTSNNSNTQMIKILHGAMTEIGKQDGLLSVTSMNNLVHNPLFSIAPPDICILFANVYPLLEAMN